ncbi:MAG: NADH-quinone oxidoreductase subunit M, partial [Pseudomonadota bacterium]
IKESLKTIQDLNRRERLILAPLVIMTLMLGIYPALLLDLIRPTVEAMISHHAAAFAAAEMVLEIPVGEGN